MKNSFQKDKKFFDFIKNNFQDNPYTLRLKYSGKETGFNTDFAITQIECRQKTQKKLAFFIKHENFLFPSVQSSEQSTHQCVASYHSSLVGNGKRIIDMTSGLGIDSFTLALSGNDVTAFEIDPERVECLNSNLSLLNNDITENGGNLTICQHNSIEWLRKQPESLKYDYIFIDPARRDASNNRTFKFADCQPDVVDSFELLQKHSDIILIKASPILDIHQIINEISHTTAIHIVCLKGECKEVLVECDNSLSSDNPEIIAIDLEDRIDRSISKISRWSCRFNELGTPGKIIGIEDFKEGMYLYDPNAALHKLHVSGKLCSEFTGLHRLSHNTDLFCSKILYNNFPGRVFQITSILSNKEIKKYNKQKREVATRNYPLSTDQLRRKLGVISGGDKFIFGAKVGNNEKPVLFECSLL